MTYKLNSPLDSAQVQLVQVWHGLRQGSSAEGVRRTDFNPGLICRHLARLVVLEVDEAKSCCVRLAGSSRCREIGYDPRGCELTTLPDPIAELLSSGLTDAVESGRPVAGVFEPQGGLQKVAFVRLPLLGADGSVRFVMCHDLPVIVDGQTIESSDDDDPIHGDIHGGEIAIAA